MVNVLSQIAGSISDTFAPITKRFDGTSKAALPAGQPMPPLPGTKAPATENVSDIYINRLVSGTERQAHVDANSASLSSLHTANIDTFVKTKELDDYLEARTNSLTNIKVGDSSLDDLKLTLPNNENASLKGLVQEFELLSKFLKLATDENHIQNVLGVLHEHKATAIADIKTQQTADLDALTTLLNADPTKISPDPAKAGEIIKTTLDTFQKAQQAELAQFTKAIDEKLNFAHKSAQLERDRVFFLATLAQNSKEMRAAIEELHNRNKKANAPIPALTLNTSPNKPPSAQFAGVDVKDLIYIKTLTGRKIYTDQNGSLEMKLPSRWINPLYYASSRQNILSDATMMAMAIRAAGHSEIAFTIKNNDPKIALAQARAAYEACRLAGYEDKDIKITFPSVHYDKEGKKQIRPETYAVTKTTDEKTGKETVNNPFKDNITNSDGSDKESLFKDGGIRHSDIENRAKKYDIGGKTTIAANTGGVAEFKVKMQEIVSEAEAKAAVKPGPAPTSGLAP